MRTRARLLWLTVFALALSLASAASGVTIDWAYIGDPGNPPDGDNCYASPCGSVSYPFFISRYEVTNAQYTEFLNAKASSDPLGLYATGMGITRSGPAGAFTYAAAGGFENKPVVRVSFFDALRFANWMNNGQGSGDTESGAYTLLGGTAIPTNWIFVGRNSGATTFLTSENEWYKAAYYGDPIYTYNSYPNREHFQPITCSAPTSAPNTANCGLVVGLPANVGSYPGTPSYYGTFDQAGNVREWTEAMNSSSRQMRGGSFGDGASAARSVSASSGLIESPETGFRIATLVPEPGTGMLLMTGLLGLAYRQRPRRRASLPGARRA